MSILDWILAAIVALVAIRCLVRGFIKEAASIVAGIVGLVSALVFHEKLGIFLDSKLPLGDFANFIGFLAAFIAGFLVVIIVGRVLREGLEAANLEKLDSFFGFIGGLVEGIILVALILVVIQIQPLFNAKKLLDDSVFARTMLPVVGPAVDKTLKPLLGPDGRQLPKIKLPKLLQPAAEPVKAEQTKPASTTPQTTVKK